MSRSLHRPALLDRPMLVRTDPCLCTLLLFRCPPPFLLRLIALLTRNGRFTVREMNSPRPNTVHLTARRITRSRIVLPIPMNIRFPLSNHVDQKWLVLTSEIELYFVPILLVRRMDASTPFRHANEQNTIKGGKALTRP